ncbi:hypothetical protein NT6N_34350 [Oceaniferula spumae]|uniref:Uncharacterized protein n=1 Tax=Oceaniferula spumae TaxID=2979115 RepID=A0AAT9FQT0_9BACT
MAYRGDRKDLMNDLIDIQMMKASPAGIANVMANRAAGTITHFPQDLLRRNRNFCVIQSVIRVFQPRDF